VPHALHVSPTTFMHGAGAVEIAAGIAVLIAPQVGGSIVAAWLAGIIANLALVGYDAHEYWDVALRDGGLFLGAVALVLLATKYSPVIRPPASTAGVPHP